MEDICTTEKKLEKILLKLSEPNFNMENGLYLNLLVTHWIGKLEREAIKTGLNKEKLDEVFLQWIITATKLWSKKKDTRSASVLSFTLNVACELSKDETYFTRLKIENVYEKLAEIVQKHEEVNVSVSFITLLSSVLEHTSGVQWLLTTGYWNDVVDTSLKGSTSYIKQKAYKFVIKLLQRSILLDKDFCEELVELLVEPLNIAAAQSEFKNDSQADSKTVYESLKPTLDLLSMVTDTLLKKFDKKVLDIFVEIEIPEATQNLLDFSRIQEFSLDLLRVRFVFLFYNLCTKLEGVKMTTHDADTLHDIGIMFDLIKAEIEKDHVRCVIEICYYAHVLYCNLDTRIPLCVRKGETIEFQNQMLLFQLVPVMTLTRQFLGTHRSKRLVLSDDVDDLRRHFYLKLAKISAIKTLDITVRWEQRLANKIDLIEDVTIGLQYIHKSKKIINKYQAALIFQPLIYSLKDLVCHLEGYREKVMPVSGRHYIVVLIDTIIDLVESFNLTWSDCLETISVLDLVCDIVQYEYADYQVTVKFLQLLNVAISRCMSPNMVLLMVNRHDTDISRIGPLLYSKCHNNQSYQIRNHALEVVRTLALDARTKFPEFTTVLFDADLPKLVVDMAVNDSVYEVRETAVKCIQALILVDDICEVYHSENHFWDTILHILIYEPKGIVRKETVILMMEMYKLYSFPENILPRIYDVMTHVAIADVHLEVKLAAIKFWAHTIEGLLKAKVGMIDRTFPPYVFSKEKKKIVNMTNKELRKGVIVAMQEASCIGTIYVLTSSLQSDDKEVIKYMRRMATSGAHLFFMVNLSGDEEEFLQPPPSPADNAIQDSPDSSGSSDNQPSSNEQFILEDPQSQYPNSPFSDIFDFNSAPATPEDSINLSPASSPSSSNTFNSINSIQEKLSVQAKAENMEIFNQKNEVLMSEDADDFEEAFAEHKMDNRAYTNMEETESLFDELLKLDDATLLEEIVSNSGCQVPSPKMIRTSQYISASWFIKTCREIYEAETRQLQQLKQDVNEFDSLLNELLREYNLDLDLDASRSED